MSARRTAGWILGFALSAILSGCIRFYFWAGEHELVIPPEAHPTPTPAPGGEWT